MVAKHSIQLEGDGIFTTDGKWHFVANIDGVTAHFTAKVKLTGRMAHDHSGTLSNQVTWSLKFDDPNVRKHPDYKAIRDELKRLAGLRGYLKLKKQNDQWITI